MFVKTNITRSYVVFMGTEGDTLAASLNKNPKSPIARWVEHYQAWRQDRIPNRPRGPKPVSHRARKLSPPDHFNVSFSLQRVIDSMTEGGVRVVPDNADFGEVLLFIKLSDAQQLYRLRRCEHCRTWYFARRDAQRYCRARCGHKARISRVPVKVRRQKQAAYMKRYRRQLKDHPNLKIRENNSRREADR